MGEKLTHFTRILIISLVPTLAIWIPFYFRIPEFWSIPLPADGIQAITANYDGPLYIVVAKSFYDLSYIKEMFSFPLPIEYYAAHFPLFPVLIWLVGTLLNLTGGSTFGFPWGMLLVTAGSSVFCLYYFSLFISRHVEKKHVLWLTFLFAIFPARWLIVRSVGSPEPLFVGAIIASIYHFDKKQYWLAGIFGAIAQLTKSPGILLFVSYFLYLTIPRFNDFATTRIIKWVNGLSWRAYPVLLIPISLLVLFIFYGRVFGDYFAYFNSGDNIHLLFPPFQIFDFSQPWVETHWLEEIIFIYLIAGLGVYYLFKQDKGAMAWFVGVFFLTILFVSHRDIMRYSLPIVPFLYVAFSRLLVKEEFKYVILLLIIPIYLYSLAFISNNVMPISNWTPLL